MSRLCERGASRLKGILWLVILAALAYGLYKSVPHFFANYQLEDSMRTAARFANVQRKTEDELRDDIYRKVQELDIPARREDIKVELTSRNCRISVKYAVEVQLPGYKLVLNFNPVADNRF
jgi:hypothetical protein